MQAEQVLAYRRQQHQQQQQHLQQPSIYLATTMYGDTRNTEDLTAEARMVTYPPERSRHEIGPVLVAEVLKAADLVEHSLVPVPAPAQGRRPHHLER